MYPQRVNLSGIFQCLVFVLHLQELSQRLRWPYNIALRHRPASFNVSRCGGCACLGVRKQCIRVHAGSSNLKHSCSAANPFELYNQNLEPLTLTHQSSNTFPKKLWQWLRSYIFWLSKINCLGKEKEARQSHITKMLQSQNPTPELPSAFKFDLQSLQK